MKKSEYIAALRELVSFIESTDLPDTWPGRFTEYSFPLPSLSIFTYQKDSFASLCAKIGSFKKDFGAYHVSAKVELPHGASFSISTNRDLVCERVVVGTRTIPAVEEKVTIEEAQPEHEEEIVEWKCGSFLNSENQGEN